MNKKQRAAQHNAIIERDGYEAVKAKGVTTPMPPSSRHALAAAADRTSATPRRKGNGHRMRNRAGARLDRLMKGRWNINRLFYRAGVNLGL